MLTRQIFGENMKINIKKYREIRKKMKSNNLSKKVIAIKKIKKIVGGE
jgi:hypothetical protein